MDFERIPTGLYLDPAEPSVLIVTGCDPYSEAIDRPVAGYLRQRLNGLLSQRVIREQGGAPVAGNSSVMPLAACLVCSDVWMLNDPSAKLRPAIAIGSPEHNAFAAFLVARQQTLLAVDGQYAVYGEEDFDPPQACIWGIDGLQTAQGAQAFIERLAGRFLDQACGQVKG